VRRLFVRIVYNSIALAGMRGPRALLAAAPLQSSHSHCLRQGTGRRPPTLRSPGASATRSICSAQAVWHCASQPAGDEQQEFAEEREAAGTRRVLDWHEASEVESHHCRVSFCEHGCAAQPLVSPRCACSSRATR